MAEFGFGATEGAMRLQAKDGTLGYLSLRRKFLQYRRNLKKQSTKGLRETSIALRKETKNNIKADDLMYTGELMASVYFKKMGVAKYQVGVKAEHGLYPEFGTGIYAEGGGGRVGGWHFMDDDGQWQFTYGQEPNYFFSKAIEQVIIGDYSKIMIRNLHKAVDRLL